MGELAKIDSFRREVAIAESIEEIQLLGIKGDVMAEMAKKLEIPLKGQNVLGRTRIELERKLRELIEQKFPKGNIKGTNSREIVKSRNGTLQTEGITKNQSSDAKILKEEERLAEEVMNEIEKNNEVITPKKVAGEIRKKKRIVKIEEIKKHIKTENLKTTGVYDVIVIDPPWDYKEHGGFGIEQYNPESNRGGVSYPTLTVNEISNIKLPLKKDAIAFLWTTHLFMRDSFEIIKRWGLTFKAIIVWDKEIMGIGRTIRMQCEFCLLCIKGTPLIEGNSERDIIREKRREHSRKPEAFYLMVERMTMGRKLDYFAREKRPNWDIYGIEAERF